MGYAYMRQPMNEVKETTVNIVKSADGAAIAYDRLGEGPALILVDGAEPPAVERRSGCR